MNWEMFVIGYIALSGVTFFLWLAGYLIFGREEITLGEISYVAWWSVCPVANVIMFFVMAFQFLLHVGDWMCGVFNRWSKIVVFKRRNW